MFCPKCGAKNPDGSKFCAGCGNNLALASPVAQPQMPPVQQPVPPEQPQVTVEPTQPPVKEKTDFVAAAKSALNDLLVLVKPLYEKAKELVLKNKLLSMGIAGGIVLILVACIVAGVLTSGSDYTTVDHDVRIMFINDEIVICDDGKIINTKIEDGIEMQRRSMDGKNVFFLTSAEDLYVYNGKKVIKIDEDVEGFYISNDGTGIVYGLDNDEMTIILYNVSKQKKATVLQDCSDLEGVAISPDGDSVLYTEETDDEMRVYYFDGKESTRIVSGEYYGIALSNDGKYIYVIDEEESLYCFNVDGDRTKLAAEVDAAYFNMDHTQILFHKEGKSYISTKGKEAVKISGNEITPMMPSLTTSNSDSYPVADLYNKVYTGYNNNGQRCAWFIKENIDKSYKLATDISYIRFDNSCEYLYYLDNEARLKCLEIADGEDASDKAVTLASYVDSYVVSSDRSAVYYQSLGGVYYANGKNGNGRRLITSEYVSRMVMGEDDTMYYLLDGDVYATRNNKKGSRVATDMEGLYAYYGTVYAYNSDAYFISNGTKKMEKLIDVD